MNPPASFVLDASVLVTRLRRSEAGYGEVRLLMIALAANDVALFIPSIALSELAAAISRGGVTTELTLAAVSELRELPRLSIVGVDEHLGDLAATLAARQRLRGCDAVYVALAQALGASLITLDRQQQERAPVTVTTRTPGQALVALT